MSREKNRKKDIKLEEGKKKHEKSAKSDAPSQSLESVISFDAYFQKLMRKDSRVLLHHKAPMRKYVEDKGLKAATEKEFDRAFSKY